MKQMEVENLVTHLQFTDDNKSVLLKPLKNDCQPSQFRDLPVRLLGGEKDGNRN